MKKEELEENMKGYCGDIKEFVRKGDFIVGNLRKFIISYSQEIKYLSTSQSSDKGSKPSSLN